MAYHRWTPDEDRRLLDAYARGVSATLIAAQIGVPVTSLRNRAGKIGAKHRLQARTVAERFSDYVLPEPNSGCWLWTGSTDRNGYGQIRLSHQLRMATHIALELCGRTLRKGEHALHRCDVPLCVNPDHLFVGTHRDNVRDMIAKRRNSPPPISKRGQGAQEYCGRGHAMVPENVYTPPSGNRRCRECFRIQRKAWRAAQRSKLA